MKPLMALLNPVYGLIFPFLFIFTIPLAICATITTTFAFSVLLFRAALVYIELALAVIPYYLSPRSLTSTLSQIPSRKPQPVPSRRRNRRSSSSSALSAGSLTPVSVDVVHGISQSVGATRDYEGIGGWRDDSEADALWAINSRLELPADHGKMHRRRATSGPGVLPRDGKEYRPSSPEVGMFMNMGRQRARTPTSPTFGDGYFPLTAGRASASTSASSSKGSSGKKGATGYDT